LALPQELVSFGIKALTKRLELLGPNLTGKA
jgi:hypothetical protein